MVDSKYIDNRIVEVIFETLEKEAQKILRDAKEEYARLPNDFGDDTEVRRELDIDLVKKVLTLAVFGKGQRALIAEWGRGHKLDRSNPELKDYLNSKYFNRRRLRHNFQIITRIEDESYLDLDEHEHKRPKPNNEYSLEKQFRPVKGSKLLLKTVEQRLDRIVLAILEAITLDVAFSKLIDGLEIKGKIS